MINAHDLYFKHLNSTEFEPIKDQEVVRGLLNLAQAGYDYENNIWLTDEAVDAKNKLINSNLRLVPFILNKIIQKIHILYMDCLSECYLVLEKCIVMFDISYKNSFSTYCHKAVLRHIWVFVRENQSSIKLPAEVIKKRVNRYNTTDDNGDFDSITGCFSIDAWDDQSRESGFKLSNNPLSFLVKKESAIRINEVMETLTERERDIIKYRFLEDEKINFNEIGLIVNLSGERVRQIETVALKKMLSHLTK